MSTQIKIKTINNEIVHPVRYHHGGEIDTREIKGNKLFPNDLCPNILVIAKKKSGKTTTLNKIVRGCATFETQVLVFSSTVNKDDNHLALKQYCNTHNIPYVGYTSIKDEEVDILEVLIKTNQEEAKLEDNSESDDEEPKSNGPVLFDSESEESDNIKKRKSKYRSPKYIVILDDLTNELKSKQLVRLLKMNRHFDCMIIISSQFYMNLLPESRSQLDFCLVFAGERSDKLEQIYKDFDISRIDLDTFKQIYHDATKEKYGFLYVDIRNEIFRRNFNKQYLIS